MLFTLLLLVFSVFTLAGLAVYMCGSLLKSAQCREDAEDERLWDYLLHPRTL